MPKANKKSVKKVKATKENNMEKFAPYIFPTIALLIVVFLTFRWYNMRTQRDGEIGQFAEGVEIENLSESELDGVLKGTDDMKSVKMINNGEVDGGIRYEIKNGRVLFTVNSQLPELADGSYQVWLKSVEKDDYRKAFVLRW